jgi:hypothetical protein
MITSKKINIQVTLYYGAGHWKAGGFSELSSWPEWKRKKCIYSLVFENSKELIIWKVERKISVTLE